MIRNAPSLRPPRSRLLLLALSPLLLMLVCRHQLQPPESKEDAPPGAVAVQATPTVETLPVAAGDVGATPDAGGGPVEPDADAAETGGAGRGDDGWIPSVTRAR